MRRIYLSILICLSLLPILAKELTSDDLKFLLEREQYQYIQKYWDSFSRFAASKELSERRLLLDYAQRTDQIELAADLHYGLARDFASLEDGLQWLILQAVVEPDSTELWIKTALLSRSFRSTADSLVFGYYAGGNQDDELLSQIQALPKYNAIIEASAKSMLDEVSSRSSSYEAIELIEAFYENYPASKWHQAAYYMHLSHLATLKDYEAMQELIYEFQHRSGAHAYISALFWMSPSARRDQGSEDSRVLNQNLVFRAQKAVFAASTLDSATVMYDDYGAQAWKSRVQMQNVKASYYYELAGYEGAGIPWGSLYGDEPDLIALYPKPSKRQKWILKSLKQVHFDTNDQGELAEYYFWRGKINALVNDKKHLQAAIKDFGQCLIYGSPRNRYDNEANAMIARILLRLGIAESPLDYLRGVFAYDGIIFEDTHGIAEHPFTRVALADFDNDGLIDILFNGQYIYRNEGDFSFTAVSDSGAVAALNSSGGLWADFNKDGQLDFVSISHDVQGNGDALLKGQGGAHFVKVNERAGEIDDGYPTEGAAFIDIDGKGYPSLYLANYESWQQRSGYPDMFYHNEGGYFSDESIKRGFRLAPYTDDPGLAGRGVAPADFDNDGQQEILVTNYRLNRNFLYKQADSLFIDVAALYGVAGHHKNGYYGHSIGADWGDIDNDGDLDIFIANLAHPHLIEISDISQLWRNDGLAHRVVGADTLYYWLFTDITKEAGITYDELHSDPLFFDADNDGYLDLYITSVYENDRSYLYRNNGDGSFRDISYLSGSRIYNGWGCAAGDLDRDGKLDLVVGSGNGCKIFSNVSPTSNSSITLKPIHKGEYIDVLCVDSEMPEHPNSPAFGTRIELWKETSTGKRELLIRELSSAKGTTSQNAPELHFGLGQASRFGFKVWSAKP